MTGDLLGRVLAPEPPPFALLHRPESTPGSVDVLVGDVLALESLADVPLTDVPLTDVPAPAGNEVLFLLPYRQIAERGFTAPDDGSPILAMTVTDEQPTPAADVLARLPDVPTTLTGERFDPPDADYADTVRHVVADEIGTGEGANFVIKRWFVADVPRYSPTMALSFFRRLLASEQGAYWTFLIHTGDRTFVGATPERHVSLRDGTAVMNPISGTYRYPPGGPTLAGVTDFLADRKEADELYMVVDEELKMMARICAAGGVLTGPYLKEMARLAHTEYFIDGHTDLGVRDILRETMFAPTVTGSPLENACRVIRRHEPGGRGYYSGVVALAGHDEHGGRTLDSAILIRTADIDAAGHLRIGVGATLVRHSDPDAEVAETAAKAAGLRDALRSEPRLGAHPVVREALARRNSGVADFWRTPPRQRRGTADLAGRRLLVVDAEDTFTAMIGHQLTSLGLNVTTSRYDDDLAIDGQDLVVLGPGPGDPRDAADPKIHRLSSVVAELLDRQLPFVAVCLSHQVLSTRLGFDLVRVAVPNQGEQRDIDLFGRRRTVGFYNTFAAVSADDKRDVAGIGVVEVSRDRDTGEVYALRGPGFASMQFHAESILTVDGPRIMADAVREAVTG